MKKLFFAIALMCLSTMAVQAQHQSITITNHSSCEAYILLWGTSSATCAFDYVQQNYISIPAGAIFNFTDPDDAGATTGQYLEDINGNQLGATGYFTRVSVYSSIPNPITSCPVTHVYNMSDCPPANTTQAITIEDGLNSCNSCGSGNVTWTATGGNIQLDIL